MPAGIFVLTCLTSVAGRRIFQLEKSTEVIFQMKAAGPDRKRLVKTLSQMAEPGLPAAAQDCPRGSAMESPGASLDWGRFWPCHSQPLRPAGRDALSPRTSSLYRSGGGAFTGES